MVAAGVSLSAAVAYSELLRPALARADVSGHPDQYDHYGDHYPPPPEPPKQESQPQPPPPPPPSPPAARDATAPSVRLRASSLSLATLLLTGRLNLRVTSNERGVMQLVATAAGSSKASAEDARALRLGGTRVSFAAPGTRRATIRVSRRARKALRKRRRVSSILVRATMRDAAGNVRRSSLRLRLRRS
jgi:hypothetical protein